MRKNRNKNPIQALIHSGLTSRCPLIIYLTMSSLPFKTVLRFWLASSQMQQTEMLFYCFSVLTHMLYHTLSGVCTESSRINNESLVPKPMLHLVLLRPEQAALIWKVSLSSAPCWFHLFCKSWRLAIEVSWFELQQVCFSQITCQRSPMLLESRRYTHCGAHNYSDAVGSLPCSFPFLVLGQFTSQQFFNQQREK